MNFDLRKTSGRYAHVSLQAYGATIDFGLLDKEEAASLLADFKSAVEDLEWFIDSVKETEE